MYLVHVGKLYLLSMSRAIRKNSVRPRAEELAFLKKMTLKGKKEKGHWKGGPLTLTLT